MMVDFTGIENSKPCPDCRQALVTKDRCERCQALADCRSGSAELAKWLEEWRVKLNDVTAERDQLRAEVDRLRAVVNDMGDLMADVRRQRDAATARAEAAEKEALDYIDYRNQAVISRNAMERRLEAAEALVAGLRGALELLLKCNALGVAIPWGRAVSALALTAEAEKEAANG